jgi:hypothetical protein
MNALTPTAARAEPMTALIPTSLDEAARLAKIMSDMSLVPRHLQGKPADCMLVIEAAMRWRMSPFAVAQATSVVQGRLNYEGKLVAAALHTSGVLSSRLRYDYEGEGKDRAVVVSAMVAGEKEPRSLRIEFAKVRTDNKLWDTQPDQQLSYAGARIWGRRFAPEVMLGVYAPQEFDEFDEAEAPEPKPVQATVVPKPYPERKMDPVAAMKRAEMDRVLDNDQIPQLEPEPAPVVDKAAVGVQALEAQIRAAATEEELHAIAGSPQVEKQRAWLAKHRPELDQVLADTLGERYQQLVQARLEAEVDAPEAVA